MYRPTKECNWRSIWEERVWQSLCSQPPSFIPYATHLLTEVLEEKKSKILQLGNEENLLVLLHIIVKLPLWMDFALRNLLTSVVLLYWSNLIWKEWKRFCPKLGKGKKGKFLGRTSDLNKCVPIFL